MKPVSVFLIGLGRVGSRFYEKFRELGESRVRIAGVCEVDSRHPLVQRAREAGVPVYEDFRSALTHSDNPVDIVLDTTNLPEVKDQLRHLLQETGNHHTILLPLLASYLLWHMASPKDDLPADHADPGY